MMKKWLLFLLAIPMIANWSCKGDVAVELKAYADITLTDIKKVDPLKFTTNLILVNQLSVGETDVDQNSVLFFKTQTGTYGKMKIVNVSTNNLIIDIYTYNQDGTVLVNKADLLIEASMLCDLDAGLQTWIFADADFAWDQSDIVGGQSFESKNGASFYVYSR